MSQHSYNMRGLESRFCCRAEIDDVSTWAIGHDLPADYGITERSGDGNFDMYLLYKVS